MGIHTLIACQHFHKVVSSFTGVNLPLPQKGKQERRGEGGGDGGGEEGKQGGQGLGHANASKTASSRKSSVHFADDNTDPVDVGRKQDLLPGTLNTSSLRAGAGNATSEEKTAVSSQTVTDNSNGAPRNRPFGRQDTAAPPHTESVKSCEETDCLSDESRRRTFHPGLTLVEIPSVLENPEGCSTLHQVRGRCKNWMYSVLRRS